MYTRFTDDNDEAKQQFANMHPIGKVGTAQEVADLVLWLSCDESSFMVGLPLNRNFSNKWLDCSMKIHLKRIYEPPAKSDGTRILVERLWPRGVAKEKAQIDHWAKEAAPSTELRKWFGHNPEKWPQFQTRYFAELNQNSLVVQELRSQIDQGPATFVFSSREERYNNAVALRKYLLAR